MEEKNCSDHAEEIVLFCFFEGCEKHFLCKECVKCHPDNHNSQIKGIMSLMRKEDWIKSNEEQRDSQMAKLASYKKEKECLFEENQKKYNGMFDEIIRSLNNRLSDGTNELGDLSNFQDNLKAKETFAKVEETLKGLQCIDFREGDIYDKVDKAKIFNERTIPNNKNLCNQLQDVIDEAKIDEAKIDSCKQEMFELIKNIHLKDLLALSNSKRQKVSKKLSTLQQEYEIVTQEKTRLNQNIESLEAENRDLKAQLSLRKEQYDELAESYNKDKSQASEQLNSLQEKYETLAQERTRLNKDIEHLKAIHNTLQTELASRTEQYDQLTGLNNDEKQKIESLTETNEQMQKEVSALKNDLDSVVASKIKINSEFEALKVAYNKLNEKYAKAEFLGEDSRIIQDKDLDTIRAWIPNPANSDESPICKLTLLYRGTRDGFTRAAFDNKCKNKNPTIVFIKSKQHEGVFGGKTTGRVFGGYTTKNWGSEGYTEDREAFLFSLTYGEKYPIKAPDCAIHQKSNCLFVFGGGHDVSISEGCNTRSDNTFSYFPFSYQCFKFENPNSRGAQEYLAGSEKFTVEEIEVYQVVWTE